MQKMATAMMRLGRNIAGKVCVRSLSSTSCSGGLLLRRTSSGEFGLRGATSIVSPPPAAARLYCVSATPQPKKFLVVTVGDMLLTGLLGLAVYDILIWTDYSGERAKLLEELKCQREAHLKELHDMRSNRDKMEAELKGKA